MYRGWWPRESKTPENLLVFEHFLVLGPFDNMGQAGSSDETWAPIPRAFLKLRLHAWFLETWGPGDLEAWGLGGLRDLRSRGLIPDA